MWAAEILSGKSDEVFESQRRNALATWPQFVTSQTYIFHGRYVQGVDSLRHRIIFNDQPYGIFPPIVDNRMREMKIQAILMSVHAD